MRRLKEEVEILRGELQRAEGELEDRVCWSPPPDLQHWLQLTYELEQRVYNKKRLQAEKQLEQAKDAVSIIRLHSCSEDAVPWIYRRRIMRRKPMESENRYHFFFLFFKINFEIEVDPFDY